MIDNLFSSIHFIFVSNRHGFVSRLTYNLDKTLKFGIFLGFEEVYDTILHIRFMYKLEHITHHDKIIIEICGDMCIVQGIHNNNNLLLLLTKY